MKQARFYFGDANAPTPNCPNHIGTAVLIEYGEKILLERRTDSGVWAVIGGGLKTNESLTEGAVREVYEETAIRLSDKELFFIKIYDDPSRIAEYPDGNIRRIITVLYGSKLDKEPVLNCSNESYELRFFSVKELEEIDIAKTHIPIISDYIKKHSN